MLDCARECSRCCGRETEKGLLPGQNRRSTGRYTRTHTHTHTHTQYKHVCSCIHTHTEGTLCGPLHSEVAVEGYIQAISEIQAQVYKETCFQCTIWPETFSGENFREFRCIASFRESFTANFCTCLHMRGVASAIHESFIRKLLYFVQFAKVFTCESFRLYGMYVCIIYIGSMHLCIISTLFFSFRMELLFMEERYMILCAHTHILL